MPMTWLPRVVCCCLVLLALWIPLMPATARAMQDLPLDAALTLEDLGPGFALDAERSGGLSRDGQFFMEAYVRDNAGIILESGPFYVANMLARGEPTPGTLDLLTAVLISSLGDTGEATVQDGPTIGDDTRWLYVTAEFDGLPVEFH